MSKRSAYSVSDAEKGRESEIRWYEWLVEMDIPHTWNNQEGESMLIDFILHLEKDVGVDCEAKSQYFMRKYWAELDFIANKCDKYPGHYLYVLENQTGFVVQTISYLLKHGIRHPKWTRRGKEEEFIQIPGWKLFYVNYKKKNVPKLFLS